MQELLSSQELEQLDFIESRIQRMEQERQDLIEQAQVRALQQFTALKDKTVVIIGGLGGLGSIFYQIFNATQTTKFTIALDLENQELAPEVLPLADLVIFSVPIHKTPELIKHYSQWIRPEAGICDLTSIKTPAMAAMLECHAGPVMGLHPMFGPTTFSLDKQLIITVDGRASEYFTSYLELLRILGARLTKTTAQRHDKIMTHMQAVRHFNTYLQGLFTAREDFTLDELVQLSSPIYGLELMMIGRLFAQNDDLYADIIYDNPSSKETLQRYAQIVQEAVAKVNEGDKATFKANFKQASEFFGDYAQEFLSASAQILEQAVALKSAVLTPRISNESVVSTASNIEEIEKK